jgi:U4/U6 small nuclear ribonucleoprotein PRP3
VNAQQYHLTGGVLICQENNINLIVVEGGKKAVKHYIRLMMRRIDWNGSNNDDGDDENEKNSKEHVKGTHRCILVWQGVVARRAFSNFRFQECKTVGTARKVMETKNVVHYWDHVERAPISPV